MSQQDPTSRRLQIERAIAAQEALRGTFDDEIIDAAITVLLQELAKLEGAPTDQKQRKQVTVLFMDVVGSTQIIRELDPEDNLAILDTALERLSVPVEMHGGQIVRYMGDGFLSLFGHPVARENDPEMGIRAGLGILQAARAYAQEVRQAWDIANFNVRVGIDTGLAVIGADLETKESLAGTVINLAARLESAAPPGGILISQRTFTQVRGVFDLVQEEAIAAKGFAEPVQVYRVLGERPRTFRSRRRGVEGIDTRMIGREAEFQRLRHLYRQVIAEGAARVVTIAGDAGLGKSRLILEFENWVDLQPDEIRLQRGRALQVAQREPFGLIRDLFASRFGIQDDDSAVVVERKVEQGVVQVLADDPEAEMKAHFLGQLLGYSFQKSLHLRAALGDARQIRERSLVYLGDYFRALSRRGPVLLVLDDLHWSDESSLDFLEELMPGLAEEPILLVGAARPALYERRPDWGQQWSFHSRLDLKPLSVSEGRRLVNEVLQRVAEIPEELQQVIASRAEGNPYYVEELVKMLVEEGVILAAEPDWLVNLGRLQETLVPPTLTGVLQARLDGLPEGERLLLQQASVVGRIFWDRTLSYIRGGIPGASGADPLDPYLEALRSRQLIYKEDRSAFTDTQEHSFNHALLREVTYEGVLQHLRRLYHALAADWLIEQSGGRVAEVAGAIGEHLERAGKSRQALEYLERAGQEAAAKYANREALAFYDRMLALLPQDDLRGRWAVQRDREKLLDMIGRRQAQQETQAEMKRLAAELGDRQLQAEVLVREANYYNRIGEFARAAETCQQAVPLIPEASRLLPEAHSHWGVALMRQAEYPAARDQFARSIDTARRTKRPELQAEAIRQLGVIGYYQGDYSTAREHFSRALELLRQQNDQRGAASSLNNLGALSARWQYHDDALGYFEQALAIREKIGDRAGVSGTLFNMGGVNLSRNDFSRALRYFHRALKLRRETGDQSGIGDIFYNLGVTYRNLGAYDAAEAHLQDALAVRRVQNDRRGECMALEHLALVHILRGEHDSAWEYSQQALSIAMEIGDRSNEAHVRIHCGRILFQTGRPEEARQAFDLARQIAEEIGQHAVVQGGMAGLIEIALGEGRPEAVRSELESLIGRLDSAGSARLCLVCGRALQALGDRRAAEIWQTGCRILREQAAGIDEEELKESFLSLPWHRELAALCSSDPASAHRGDPGELPAL